LKDKYKIKAKKWAYLAGLIDGDGTIAITKSFVPTSNYYLYDTHIAVHSTDKKSINWLIETFGGQFNLPKETRDNRKQGFCWYVSNSSHQRDILRNLAPYLVLKTNQALLMLEYLELGGKNFQNPGVREQLQTSVSKANNEYPRTVKTEKIEGTNDLSKIDYSYLAGMFDAEGSFFIGQRPKRNTRELVIALTNSNMRLFDWLLPKLGGRVIPDKRSEEGLGYWTLRGSYKEKHLLGMLPYLVNKRRQAIIALEWTRHSRKLPREQKDKYFSEMKILNQRGKSPTANTPDLP
jgi:hypothetical protein